MTMQPLNFPLEGRIVGAAPDRPGATIQNYDLVSPRFVVFGKESAQANCHETLQIGPTYATFIHMYVRTFVRIYNI